MVCCCSDPPVDLDGEVDLYHFHLHRAVGKGAFGKVRVVEHKRDGTLYALKYIDKKNCIAMQAVKNIIQERRLLEEIDHTFICNMRFAFQDDVNCFMVLDLMLGGDLRFHYERNLTLGEDAVRFYVAELSSAVSYLHSKRILHRDIKPDNVLLDKDGHVHLTDFNVACHIERGHALRSRAGTVYYMAPEVIYGTGYKWSCDWWSLGVMALELMYGRRPFRGKKSKDIMRAIMHDAPEIPDETVHYASAEARDFVLRLLDKNSATRLACRSRQTDLAELRAHPWLAGYDWDKLDAKAMPPPFVPDSKRLNFDFSHELDEYMSPSEQLTHKRRKNRDTSKLSAEMLQLEEEFTVWDYMKMERRSYHELTQPVMTVKPSSGSPVASRPGTALAAPAPAMLRDSRPSDVACEMDELTRSRRTPTNGSDEQLCSTSEAAMPLPPKPAHTR